jgi:hypothetical protein
MPKSNQRTLDIDSLLQELADVLAQADGEYIAEICNRVMTEKVEYNGDSIFTLTHEDQF